MKLLTVRLESIGGLRQHQLEDVAEVCLARPRIRPPSWRRHVLGAEPDV